MGISTTDNYRGRPVRRGDDHNGGDWRHAAPVVWRQPTRFNKWTTKAWTVKVAENALLYNASRTHSKTRTNVIIKYHQSMCVGLSSFQCLSSSSVDCAPTVWAQLFPRSSAMKNDLVLVRWLNVDRGWDFLRSSLIVHWQCQVWRRRPLGRLQLLGGLRDARSARLWSSAWSARVTWPNSLNRLCPLMTVQCCN